MLDKYAIAVEVDPMPDWINVVRCPVAGVCILLVGMLLVSSCGSSPTRIIRQDGDTVLDIMRGTGGEVANTDAQVVDDQRSPTVVRREVGKSSIGHGAYTRDAINEVRQLFPTLPNPTIALYIHAHPVVDPNTGETLPVPAYTTVFPLYSRVEFAMPGELPSSRDPIAQPYPAARATDEGVPFSDTGTY